MKKNQYKILLTGGGTGGHIQPLLAVAAQLRRIAADRRLKFEFLHIGSNPTQEKEVIEQAGITYDYVLTGKLRRYVSLKNLIDAGKIPIGIMQAYFKVKKFNPDVVFGKGGYASVPAVVAAGWLHKPILIHESDTSAGLANRKIAKYATRVAVGFAKARESFPSEKVVVTGNPVRPEILQGSKSNCLDFFNFTGAKPILFVTGGSLGARTLNRVVAGALPQLLEKFDIIHQCGHENLADTVGCVRLLFGENRLKKQGDNYYLRSLGYRLRPYLRGEMGAAYAGADLVIARAGANNVTEIAALGKPSILVPLPMNVSRGEQISNAGMLAKAGASVVFLNQDFNPADLVATINRLFADRNKLAVMGKAARQFYQPDAAIRLADEIFNLARYVN
jgi:UDP-N-acetylglucosamine--N-acetylmuramyl-(pentapeptide) pyrophosphoryl-undecaprenol N-acetylglucosamine transferase